MRVYFAWALSTAVRIGRGRGQQPFIGGGASYLVRTSSSRFSANRTASLPWSGRHSIRYSCERASAVYTNAPCGKYRNRNKTFQSSIPAFIRTVQCLLDLTTKAKAINLLPISLSKHTDGKHPLVYFNLANRPAIPLFQRHCPWRCAFQRGSLLQGSSAGYSYDFLENQKRHHHEWFFLRTIEEGLGFISYAAILLKDSCIILQTLIPIHQSLAILLRHNWHILGLVVMYSCLYITRQREF